MAQKIKKQSSFRLNEPSKSMIQGEKFLKWTEVFYL